jgi:hypothetical protein
LVVWIAGVAALPPAVGVDMAPALSIIMDLLDRRLGWIVGRAVSRSASAPTLFPAWRPAEFGPSALQLFVVFPLFWNSGPLGIHLGMFTPALVLVYNAVWGTTASAWLRYVHGR